MKNRKILFLFVVFSSFIGSCHVFSASSRQALKNTLTTSSTSNTSLLVVISYDQMRGDYMKRWQKYFSKKGFNRILNEGLVFEKASYKHASTMTAPGHATILSGSYPARTGIISNDIYDRKSDKEHYILDDKQAFIVGNKGKTKIENVSPISLQVGTLGDSLKHNSPESKVVSVAIKDRAAILMAGKNPDAAIWLQDEIAEYGTSTYYADTLPRWVREWNKKHSIKKYAGKTWHTTLSDEDSPFEDAQAWEGNFPGGGKVFPHRIPAYNDSNVDNFVFGYACTPYSIENLFGLATQAVEAEKLGKRGQTDLLAIGVSTTDILGHVFGPDSRELLELYIHADRILGNFIDYLDSSVGRKNYTLVITSDHGICPIPELMQYQKIDAGRLKAKEIVQKCEEYLQKKYGASSEKYILSLVPPSMYFNPKHLIGEHQTEIPKATAEFLKTIQGIGIALPTTEIARGNCPEDVPKDIFSSIKFAFHNERCGEIMLFPQRYWIFGKSHATSHGTPHDYDASVPLAFFGGMVRTEISQVESSPADIAPTLAKMLSLRFEGVHGKPLDIEKK